MSLSDTGAQSMIDNAESAFKVHDYESALGFANKAKELDPNYQGIQKFIAAYSVHVAAYANIGIHNLFANISFNDNSKRKLNDTEMDWYKILDVSDDSVDIETIKKQYKKMAILVHPDKNKSVAAEGAFKIVSDAWNVLSNQSKRMAYDQRSGRGMYKRTATSSTTFFHYTTDEFANRPPPTTTTTTSRAWTGGFGSRQCPKCFKPCEMKMKNKHCYLKCKRCLRRFHYFAEAKHCQR